MDLSNKPVVGVHGPLTRCVKLLVRDPGMYNGTCVTHVSSCMSESLSRGSRETYPAFSAHQQRAHFAYLVRGPCVCVRVTAVML